MAKMMQKIAKMMLKKINITSIALRKLMNWLVFGQIFYFKGENLENLSILGSDKTAYLATDLSVTAVTVMILNARFLGQ